MSTPPLAHIPFVSRLPRLGLLWLSILCLCSVATRAAEPGPGARFDDANILYEQGLYEGAADAYRDILAGGIDSAAIRFNLGNALYQSGHIGLALGEYYQALAISPRDPDIIANIRFLREKLGEDSAVKKTFWQHFLLQLTLNEWTVITLVPFWLWLGTAALGQWLATPSPFSPLSKGAGLTFAIAAFLLANAAHQRLGKSYGVVTTQEAVVRFGPFEESKSSHNLPDGVEVEILDEKDGWHQIRDPKDQLGWIKQNHLAILPPLP